MQLERLAANHGVQLSAAREGLPQRLHLAFERQQEMRYGENPHQKAAFYVPAGSAKAGFAAAKQLQGKDLSYNNLVDLDSAWKLAQEFARPAVAIIKHNNPCGTAEDERLAEAYRQALACDPVSAFGGVLACNRIADAETAEEMAKLFVECLVAPGFEPRALEIFAGKKNLRLLQMPSEQSGGELELKRICGGALVQEPDSRAIAETEWRIVTRRAPSDAERRGMAFAWKVCKHVKSNAIVFAREGRTLGIGAGQMSRVDSVKIAVMKAQVPLAGSVVASDAFFPFADGVEEAAKAGATAVIQPGGSVRDDEVIAAADRLGLAMVFTGVRHFRH
jgi:phosphoribosylaminoimidazolecarboxamide formyltransferase/IMP cyclohydrolase